MRTRNQIRTPRRGLPSRLAAGLDAAAAALAARFRATDWRELGVLTGCAFVLAAAQPAVFPGFGPEELPWPLLRTAGAFFAPAPVIVLLRGLPLRRVFVTAWRFATLYFFFSLYWIANSLIEFAKFPLPPWATWLPAEHGYIPVPVALGAIAIMAGVCAVYWAVAFTLAELAQARLDLKPFLTLPVAFTACEFLRNYLLSGFPWSQLGYSQTHNVWLRQVASLCGVYGLTFLVAFVAGVAAAVLFYVRGVDPAFPRRAVWTAVTLVAVAHLWGVARLARIEELLASGRNQTVRVAVLQGNVGQGTILAGTHHRQILAAYRDLVNRALADKAQLIVWPEAAFPGKVQARLRSLGDTSWGRAPIEAWQIVGASVRDDVVIDNHYISRQRNSAFAVAPDLRITARYDKSHLVPFGEYVPLGIPVEKLVKGVGFFVPGESLAPLRVGLDGRELRLGMTICYEGVFPEIARATAQGREGAELLLNLTNDAWWGATSGPQQHLAMYQWRAVETGRFVARATNSGFSAFIDPAGRVLQRTQLDAASLLTADVVPLSEPTLYILIGDLFAWTCLFLTLVLAGVLVAGVQRKPVWRRL